MPTIEVIQPKRKKLKLKKRVAAYARVSTDAEGQLHSASAQVSYYSNLIQKNQDWAYAGVYADYGISGTQTKKRDEFQKMLADAESGKIDLILTKSISRFARNTVDTLKTIRHLKEIGVEVRFEKENISTFTGDGELMLTIYASFAQEESASISENVKWGLAKRAQAGKKIRSQKHMLGYRYDDKLKQYVIIPEEAEIVRQMFHFYVEGVSLRKIASWLNSTGLKGGFGATFQEPSIRALVHNEIYAGDILYQKTYTENPISHKQRMNRGELPQYYQDNAHEAIIDRETWNLVQKEHERRKTQAPKPYIFSQKIKCGKCGKNYVRLVWTVEGKNVAYWTCRTKKVSSKLCNNQNIEEEELKGICAWAMGKGEYDEKSFSEKVISITVTNEGDLEFQMSDGTTKIWKQAPPQFSENCTCTQAFQKKIYCGTCGAPFHLFHGKKWSYWFCTGSKARNEKKCPDEHYRDYFLRDVSAQILGLDHFDEQIFTDKIERIRVEADGSLTYRFFDGKEETWEKT